MNEDDRKILQRNRTYIIKNIHNIDDVNSQLFEHEVFSEGMRDEVEAEGTKEKRIRKLLDIVTRRGPTAFRSFIQVLVDTDNNHVADTLYPNASSVFPRNTHVHPPYSAFQPAQEELPTSMCFIQYMSCTLCNQMLSDIVEEIYKPDHKDAECFILVIMTHGCREGVYGVDGEVLSIDKVKDLMNGNNFLVMAGKPKLVFIQACRGEQYDEGVTMTQDATAEIQRSTQGIRLGSTLLDSNQETKELTRAHIPIAMATLVICKDKRANINVTMTQDATAEIQRSMQRIRLGSSVPDSNQETKEPTGAHIMIAMATTLDMVSFRNKVYGSWFLQAVVYVFQKFAFQDDLFKLMIKVSTFRLKIGHRCVTKAGLNLKV
ncbi:hypothetical protein FSP39_010374 [Pinctada imbricata]|uniref:Uncharacterized protein n=1 Tax=Pinctada imbricata TaxID=66713 RepID=A0AA88YTD1_PINIB|nr:hypothetical protein FSP39_010374 [Pinctada imbricata]